MVKWILVKGPYGRLISSLADFHEFLVSKGYGYYRTKEYKDKKKVLYKKGNSIVEIVRIESGLPARAVNIPISANMRLTRLHGTPDVYKLRKRKVKK